MSATPDIHRVFRVAGRVQGVGFRWWTRQQAGALGVRGSVRNLSDGAVEVSASGTQDQLDRLETLLRQGPPSSHVVSVTTSPGFPPASAGFTIEQ